MDSAVELRSLRHLTLVSSVRNCWIGFMALELVSGQVFERLEREKGVWSFCCVRPCVFVYEYRPIYLPRYLRYVGTIGQVVDRYLFT